MERFSYEKNGYKKSDVNQFIKEVIGETEATGNVTVSIVVDGLNTKVLCGDKELGEASVANLSTEVAGGFVGCCIGIYASANGKDSDTYVNFTRLTYDF